MAKKKPLKTCYFQIETPQRHQVARPYYYFAPTNTLLEDPHGCLYQSPTEVAEMPRIKFQAELTFGQLVDKRVTMQDRLGRRWSVYIGDMNKMVPRMVNGSISAWWTIVKHGNLYGLHVDVETPLMTNVPTHQDVPLMLNQVNDIRTLLPEFTAMAVC